MIPPVSEIKVAEISDVLFVQVIGKGTMANSEALYRYALDKLGEGRVREVAFDLGECDYLDSTFLGVVAALSKRTRSQTGLFSRLVRVSEKALPYLQTTGLTRVLDCGNEKSVDTPATGLVSIEGASRADKAEMTRHILMAHEELIALCETNRDRFQNVVEMLRKSAAKRENGN